MSSISVRKARMDDAKRIHKLVYACAQREVMLPRSLGHIYSHLRDFIVAEVDDELVGCCGLSICWEGLGEIRSLVVAPEHQGHGLGSELVNLCLNEARSLGLTRIFALTYVDGFFSKLGFVEVGKEVLPQKVWADCVNCPRFPDCDEIAMVLEMPPAHEGMEGSEAA